MMQTVSQATPYLVAHITDLHIKAGGKLSYRRVDTADALRQCIDTLLALPQRPDIAVVTGDLVDFGSEDEYRFLRGILETLPIPVRLMPGNHDSREALRRVFADHAYVYVFAAGDGSRFRMEPPGSCCTGGIRCMGWLRMRRRLEIMGRCFGFLMRRGG